MQTYIDLFSGPGGFSQGFSKNGFIPKLAIDIDMDSVATFNLNNIKNPVAINADIKDYSNIFMDIDSFKNLDLIIGGPPCQGFSNANRQNIIDDPRNELYKYFLKVVSLLSPKIVIIENVEGIKNKFHDISEIFKKIGYFADYKILQASDFSIPQNRKRLFILALNKSFYNANEIDDFFMDLESRSKLLRKFKLKDALFGLPKIYPKLKKNDYKNEDNRSGWNEWNTNKIKKNEYLDLINSNKKITKIYNHKARFNNSRDIEIFSLLPQGGDSTDESIQHIMPYKRRKDIFKDKYFKLSMDKICKTITSHMKFDCNMYIHPTQARGLSPREAARVQSFPDYYFFKGSINSIYNQIGNAVPPLISKQIAKSLKDVIIKK